MTMRCILLMVVMASGSAYGAEASLSQYQQAPSDEVFVDHEQETAKQVVRMSNAIEQADAVGLNELIAEKYDVSARCRIQRYGQAMAVSPFAGCILLGYFNRPSSNEVERNQALSNRENYNKMIPMLAGAGANLNTEIENTPAIIGAAQRLDADLVELLLKHGANDAALGSAVVPHSSFSGINMEVFRTQITIHDLADGYENHYTPKTPEETQKITAFLKVMRKARNQKSEPVLTGILPLPLIKLIAEY